MVVVFLEHKIPYVTGWDVTTFKAASFRVPLILYLEMDNLFMR